MAFTPLQTRRGRLPDCQRVTAGPSGNNNVIAISISHDLTHEFRLRANGAVRVEYGTGADRGWIRLTRTNPNSAGAIPLHQNGVKLYININEKFLPSARTPAESIELPFRASGYSLLIDYRPLSPTNRVRNRSNHSERSLA